MMVFLLNALKMHVKRNQKKYLSPAHNPQLFTNNNKTISAESKQ